LAKKNGKTKGRGKRHLQTVPSAPKMPLQLVLNHRVVDSLTMEFIQWLGPEAHEPSEAVESLELVKLVMSAQHAIRGSSSATVFDVAGVDEAAEAIVSALEPGEFEDALIDIFDAVLIYVDFLVDSGRWTGTDAAYEELIRVLANAGGPEDSPGGKPIRIPARSEEQQDTAFNAMPLIKWASSLLDWIGEGKEVSATGALRLKDIEAAAAAVGVKARGKHGAGRPVDPDGLDRDLSRQDAPLDVSTMFDVPFLADIWTSLVRAGLLTVGTTSAEVGPQFASWNSPDAGERVRIRRSLTIFQLLASIGDPYNESREEHLDPYLLIVLARGTGDNPMPVADLDQLAADGEDPHSSFLALRAKNKLAALAKLGVVEADTSYRVAEVAIQCVASVLEYIESEELLPDDEAFDLDGGGIEVDDGEAPANVIPISNSAKAATDR
jgi:hypothetical protein